MSEHNVILTYTINDDGVWLECSCGWSHNLGQHPTVEAAVDAEEDHLTLAQFKDAQL